MGEKLHSNVWESLMILIGYCIDSPADIEIVKIGRDNGLLHSIVGVKPLFNNPVIGDINC